MDTETRNTEIGTETRTRREKEVASTRPLSVSSLRVERIEEVLEEIIPPKAPDLPPEEKHLSVYGALDSWEKAGPEIKEGGRRQLNPEKSRRKSLSISVSPQEQLILRAAAAEDGRTFSDWARSILFRVAERREPYRPVGSNKHPKGKRKSKS